MKKILMLGLVGMMSACSKVPAGFLGVKVYLLGGNKGVNQEVLGVGRYWIGMNEELHLFPIFQKSYTWTVEPIDGDTTDESITFQTKEGMAVNADVGISFSLNPDKVADIFQKYRRGVDELTDTVLRNAVRDTINELASSMSVEETYGAGKVKLFNDVRNSMIAQFKETGIIIDNVYLVGSMRLPKNVVEALNSKIEATQRAQQRENEVQEARAQAAKAVATAEGEAKAMLTRAEAEAKANKLKLQTLTPQLIQYEAIQKWDGKLSQISGGAVPFINLDMKGRD